MDGDTKQRDAALMRLFWVQAGCGSGLGAGARSVCRPGMMALVDGRMNRSCVRLPAKVQLIAIGFDKISHDRTIGLFVARSNLIVIARLL